MKFGAFVPQGLRWDLPLEVPDTDHWAIMLSVARTIESSGFDSLWVWRTSSRGSKEPTPMALARW